MSEWIAALIVYGIIGLIIYFNRKKFVVMSKVIFAYMTKKPIAWMDKLSKAGRLWKVYSTICIPIGFYYMVIVFYSLLQNAINIIITPSAGAGVAPLIPGVQIPGSPIYVPLFYGLIAIGVLAFIHEFAHGVIARTEGIRVKNTGFGLALIFPFFFVEPNEKDVNESSKLSRLRFTSAGASSNILLSMGLLLLSLTLLPFIESNVELTGIQIAGVYPNYPAENAGIMTGEIIRSIDGKTVINLTMFSELLKEYNPSDTIILTTDNNTYSITLAKNPNNELMPYIGVSLKQLTEFSAYSKQVYGSLLDFLLIVYELLTWIALLNFFVGIINLLPMWFLDGGKMLYDLLSYFIPKKYVNKITAVIFNTSLILLIINIMPFFTNLFVTILS